ncbi:MAG: hypothetical protein ACYDDS_19805 [Candidatus Sulfotelmatobacter sp.]
MFNSEVLTPETMKLNDVEPEGFTSEPRSLFFEVTKLREAVLRLCDLQQELAQKVETALNPHPIAGDGESNHPAQVV